MAQRSSHSNSWENNPFLPSFFNGGNSPGVSGLSSNNNGHGQYTSTNSTLFPGQDDHNISSGSHQDHTPQAPFSINSVNGTGSKIEDQSQELLEILLQKASPTKQKIQENILAEIKLVVKNLMKEIKDETLEEMKHLTGRLSSLEAEVKRLSSHGAEMETLWTRWISYL